MILIELLGIILSGIIIWRIQFTYKKQEEIFSKILPHISKLKDIHNEALVTPPYWVELSITNESIKELEDLSIIFFYWFGDKYKKPFNELIFKMKSLQFDVILKSEVNFANQRLKKIESAHTLRNAIKKAFSFKSKIRI